MLIAGHGVAYDEMTTIIWIVQDAEQQHAAMAAVDGPPRFGRAERQWGDEGGDGGGRGDEQRDSRVVYVEEAVEVVAEQRRCPVECAVAAVEAAVR